MYAINVGQKKAKVVVKAGAHKVVGKYLIDRTDGA